MFPFDPSHVLPKHTHFQTNGNQVNEEGKRKWRKGIKRKGEKLEWRKTKPKWRKVFFSSKFQRERGQLFAPLINAICK